MISDARQIAVHTPEALVHDPSPFEVEIAVLYCKVSKSKSPGSDQIPRETIQAGGETLQSEVLEVNNSVWNEEELPDELKEAIIVPVYKKGGRTD
jgi:hypothetical protein